MATDDGLEIGLPLRKSSQEVEIDHLLAEEFSCDPSFVKRFIAASGLSCPDFQVMTAVAEPSLGGEGFGDLLIQGTANGLKIALLIEDKVTAGPAIRQAARYASHAERLRSQGWDRVWTVLVAPASYRGERTGYDSSVDLETITTIIASPDPLRLAYRRAVIERALMKKATAGVRVPDLDLHKLKSDYLQFASDWCAANRFKLDFPALRKSYYDGDSWIEPVRNAILPMGVWLRHRLWTSTKDACGFVDLIISPAPVLERDRLKVSSPAGAVFAPFSKGKGVQISIPVPEMRQSSGFNSASVAKALQVMRALVTWYSSACA